MALTEIVVGLDDSPTSADALRWSSGLAAHHGIQASILSTWTVPVLAAMASTVVVPPDPAILAASARDNATKVCTETGLSPTRTTILEGDAGACLATETSTADLVVVGRTGSGQSGRTRRLAELVLGSTARYLLHHAQGAVAVVPAGSTWVPSPSVVVGVDGSQASIAAVRWAITMLPRAASITALQAVPPYLEGLLALDRRAMEKVVAATTDDLTETISLAQDGLSVDAGRVKPTVVIDNTRYALTRPGLGADIIIVGARGRSRALAPLLGSTSDHVVRHAPCPVVVIPQ